MLSREVLRLRGTLANRETEWDVVPDLYFYRDPEAEENKEVTEEAKAPGADEVGPAAIDTGFANGADWEVTGPGQAAVYPGDAAPTADANWNAEGGDWAAAGGATATADTWTAGASGAAGAAPTEAKW